jgi:hypothetical protein
MLQSKLVRSMVPLLPLVLLLMYQVNMMTLI